MPLNYTPLSWKNVDPLNKDQMKVFLQQLSDFLNSAFNPAFLSFALNGQGLLNPGSMSSAANTLIGNNTGSTAADKGLTGSQIVTMLSSLNDLGTVTTNQSVNCANAAFIVVRVAVNAATFTLTLQNLTSGAQFFLFFANASAGSCTMTMAGTTPTLAITAAISGAAVDMVATGFSFASGIKRVMWGSATSTNLWLGFA